MRMNVPSVSLIFIRFLLSKVHVQICISFYILFVPNDSLPPGLLHIPSFNKGLSTKKSCPLCPLCLIAVRLPLPHSNTNMYAYKHCMQIRNGTLDSRTHCEFRSTFRPVRHRQPPSPNTNLTQFSTYLFALAIKLLLLPAPPSTPAHHLLRPLS